MKKIVFAILAVCFLICQNPLQAQVDTIRGKVPYWHYNYYDSTWCQSHVSSGVLHFDCPGNAIVNKVGTPRTDYYPSDTDVSGCYA